MTLDERRQELAALRARKIRLENRFADDLADLEAEIDESETRLVQAEEAEWAVVSAWN